MKSNIKSAGLFLFSVTVLMTLTSGLNAQNVFGSASPYSGGLLAAKAVRSGSVKFQSGGGTQEGTHLGCTPAPCVFTPVQVSEGGAMVDEDPVVVNPNNSLQLLSGVPTFRVFTPAVTAEALGFTTVRPVPAGWAIQWSVTI